MPAARLRINFTRATVDSLPPAPAGKRDYYNDTKVQGLQLQVTDKGAKSYYLYIRNAGKPLRHKLGRHPALTPENARKLAETDRGRAATGVNLREERQAAIRNAATLSDALIAFEKVRTSLKPTTLYHYRRYLEVAFEDWMPRPLVEITKDGVAKRHLKLTAQHGAAYADGAMRTLRAIINFAQVQYEAPDGTPLLPDNPVRRLSQMRAWNRVKRRTTYVKPDQIRPWFEAVLGLKTDPADHEGASVSDWLQLLMLTGLRRSEGLTLKWQDVDLANRLFVVRDTKNGEDHYLPLSDHLLDMLKARKAIAAEGAEFVFSSYGQHGHLVDPRKPLERVIQSSGVKFMPHDLRRTFITIAESLDVPAFALRRLLNHKMRQDMTAHYLMPEVERLRRPMQQVTDFVLRSAGLKPSAEIRTFPSQEARHEQNVG